MSDGESAAVSTPSGFPNPARGAVLFSGWHPASTLRIHALHGALVAELRTGADGTVTFDTAALATGSYTVTGLDAAARRAAWTLVVE